MVRIRFRAIFRHRIGMKRPAQIACGTVLVLLILWLADAQLHFLPGLGETAPLQERELATQFLGKYLSSHYAGNKAIVLSNPFSLRPEQPREINQFEKAGLRGLGRGLKGAVQIEAVVFPEIRSAFITNRHAVFIDPATTTPLSYVVAEDALDKLANQHAEAHILVSLIGLPINVLHTETWRADNPRKFALLLPDLRMLGGQLAVIEAIRSRKIAVMVLKKPGAPAEDQPLSRNQQMEFDSRFVLVTPETVDQVLLAYPRLF